MPDIKTHCEISLKRTGETFEELHKWIDEAQAFFGTNHRIERHAYNDVYEEYIEKRWKKIGVVEWLFHIALDNLETANKFASEVYDKSYGEIKFNFDDNNLIGWEFKKFTEPKAKKSVNTDFLNF